MKIALNLAGLRSTSVGGAKIYAQHLVEGLAESGHDLTLLTTAGLPPELSQKEIETIRFGSANYHELTRMLYEFHAIGHRARRGGFDIMHSLGGYGIPIQSGGPAQIVTAYDMLSKAYPEFFNSSRRIKRHMSFTVGDRFVSKYIAISKFTKYELVKHTKVAEDRIAVVLLGSATREHHVKAWPEEIDNVIESEPYAIYPASFTPHKNHEVLFAGLKLLATQGHEVPNLVLTGLGTDSKESVDLARSYGLGDKVRALGWVDRDVSLTLLANASMLLFPSKYEGFGLPVIEAMSLGVPSIVANSGSLPEVAGSCALFFEPDSAIQLANAISKVMGGRGNSVMNLERARVRGDSYSWEKCVSETLDVYHNIVNGC